MTLLEIVAKLEEKGYQVKYSVRSDGGILIREINGQHFKGAAGNAQARAIVGAELSAARRIQLIRIKPKKGQSPISRKQEKVTQEEVLKYMRRVQRKWRKNVDIQKSGQITIRKVRYNLKSFGIEETMRKLKQAENYAEGIAYSEVVEALIGYIQQLSNKLGNPAELENLIELIEINKDNIRDEWIKPAYDALYNANSQNIKDVINNVKRILRIS